MFEMHRADAHLERKRILHLSRSTPPLLSCSKYPPQISEKQPKVPFSIVDKDERELKGTHRMSKQQLK
jgi:hypothetical protein